LICGHKLKEVDVERGNLTERKVFVYDPGLDEIAIVEGRQKGWGFMEIKYSEKVGKQMKHRQEAYND
jgi:hypothetical protein